MTDFVVLRRVQLGPSHKPTGATVHRRGNEVLPSPHALQIIQFSNDTGFYLIRLDGVGDEITDTLHDTIDDAVAQAKFEFGVMPEDWTSG